MAMSDIARLPVYAYLAQSKSPHMVQATIKDDIAALRRSGEDIEVATGAPISSRYDAPSNATTEYRYYVRDCATIKVPSNELNIELLIPLLSYKEQSTTGAFAQIGLHKVLADSSSGENQHHASERMFKLTLPSGRCAPTVAQALQQRKFLRISYASLKDHAPQERVIYPVSLEIHHQAFYVRAQKMKRATECTHSNPSEEGTGAGHDSSWMEAGIRTYKLDRIHACEIIEHPEYEGLPDHIYTCEKEQGSESEDSWFAPVDAVYWAAHGACIPLTERSEYVYAAACGTLPGAVYLLRGADRFQLLEDLAFYAGQMKLVEPPELVQFAREKIEYTQCRMSAHTACAPQMRAHTLQPHQSSQTPSVSSQAPSTPGRSIDITVSRRESYFTYLLKNGPTTLGDLARHFRVTPTTLRKELSDLYTTELRIGNTIVAPYDIHMPEWDGTSPLDPSGIVEALPSSQQSHITSGSITLTLPEVMSLVAAIDSLLIVAQGEHQRALIDMRNALIRGASDAGYATALWSAPTTRFSPRILATVEQAISDYRWLDMTYWKLDNSGIARAYSARIQPFTIDAQPHPLLAAYNEHSHLRTYRLDRISDARLADEHFKKTPVRTWLKNYRTHQIHIDGPSVLLYIRPHGRWICEELPGVTILSSDQSILTVRICVRNIHWLRSVLVCLGTDFLDIEPDSVKSALQSDLSAITF